jgi:DNA-binding MarR family transcriptional regulator
MTATIGGATAKAKKLESPALRVWVRLLRGHASARRSLHVRLHADHDLSVSAFEALLLLSRAEGRKMRRVDLAEGLQLTASGVTRLLDGLEAEGLVAKATCEADGRVTYAVLTHEGRSRLERAACSHVAAIKALFEERFTPEELETLAELLERIPGACPAPESG